VLTVRALDRRPLAVAPFRRLWLASAIAAVGGSFSVIAVPVQLFALTGSSAAVGWSAAVSFPMLVLAALWTGSLADLMDRRRLLLRAHAGLALSYLLLWGQTATHRGSVPILLVLVGVQSLSYGAIMTTGGAVLPRVLPADLLPAANSLNSLIRYIAAVVGPLLAGLLIPLVGLGPLYLFDAIALIGVLWAVLRLPPLPSATAPASRAARGSSVLAGFRRLASDRVLPAVLGIDLAAMVFGMPTALFPELASGELCGSGETCSAAAGARALGLLHAAYPAGVIALGLLSGTFTRTRRPGALMAAAAGFWGLTLILAGLSTSLWFTLAVLGLGGAANLVLSTCRNTITQAQADDGLRGRIQGALTIVLFGGPQAAVLVHGLAGSALGARPATALGGLLTMTTVALITAAAPQVRRYTQPDPDRPELGHGRKVSASRRFPSTMSSMPSRSGKSPSSSRNGPATSDSRIANR
jgi:MFS family permease